MSVTTFVRTRRKEIDRHILTRCPNIKKLNDKERTGWVLNDEYLYNWYWRHAK